MKLLLGRIQSAGIGAVANTVLVLVALVAQRSPPGVQPVVLSKISVAGAFGRKTMMSSSMPGIGVNRASGSLALGMAGKLAGTYTAPVPMGMFQMLFGVNGQASGLREVETELLEMPLARPEPLFVTMPYTV